MNMYSASTVAAGLDLGTVPAWVGTASVVFAAFAFWRSTLDKKREQASKVAAWIQGDRAKGYLLRVRNNSDAPVYRLTVMKSSSLAIEYIEELEPNQGICIPITAPSRGVREHMEQESAVRLHFRDALGRWWIRKKSGKLKASRKKDFGIMAEDI